MYNNYMSDGEMESETKKMSKKDKTAYGSYDKKMMAEHDVKLLAEAGEIKADAGRLKRAIHCAKMQREYVEEVVD